MNAFAEALLSLLPIHRLGPRMTAHQAKRSAAPSPHQVVSYTVQVSDTLHEIARRQLGDWTRWAEIWADNPQLGESCLLHSGMVLRLPSPR
jgi:nucleoid-associated protein YgaU